MVTMEMNKMKNLLERFDQRHGGPFDRGAVDSYYHRSRNPHYFTGATNMSQKVKVEQMTFEEILAYNAGYDYNEKYGDKKDWGDYE